MRVRRTALKAAIAGTIAVLVLAACGDTDDLDEGSGDSGGSNESYQLEAASGDLPASVQAIKDKGKLVVGTKFDQPGFGLQNPSTGAVEGFDTEIARLIATRIFGDPSKVEFKESKSAVREQLIQNGSVDVVVATYTINDDRKTKVDFAGPYFEAGQDILVRSDNTSIKSVTDLNGKKVCTQAGSTSIDNVGKEAPEAQVTPLDSYALCAEGVSNGTYDAVTTDNVILLGLAQGSNGELKLVNKPFSTEPYGIGLKKGDDEFREFVNDTIQEIYDNGDWNRAWEKTIGEFLGDPRTPPAVDRYTSS